MAVLSCDKLGPTLWHFQNDENGSNSIELTVEDLKSLIRRVGFVITEEREIETSYSGNPVSMLQHTYLASFFIATKV